MTSYEVYPIGKICYDEEGMMIRFDPAYAPGLKTLDGFSHISVLWWFSGCDDAQSRAVLEAGKPYKKAPEVMGVFATRSPMRPNPLALTVSEVIGIDCEKGVIRIAYTDADDGTPVLDIKPYTPSLDRVEHPRVPDWCGHWPKSLEESGEFEWGNEFNF